MKFRLFFWAFAPTLIVLSLASCKSTPKLNPESVAPDIAKDIGIVQKTWASGNKGPVFVFEEVHTSRVGQLQIAAMLVRLHDRYGVTNISLEGSIWTGKALDSGWYHNAVSGQSDAREAKEDLAIRMVSDGEISSAEMMAMLFPDVRVYGVEDRNQYNQELNSKGGTIDYLLAIAEATLTEDDARKVNSLLAQNKPKDQRAREALEYMLNANPWVKGQYENLKKSSSFSSEQMIARLKSIQAKAREVGAQVPAEAQQDMQAEIQFMQTASERSATMVTNALQLPDTSAKTPEVLIIGAAHADKVIELLQNQNVSYSLIQPLDLDTGLGSMTSAEYERKIKGKWASNLPGTLGYVLNRQKKPPPVIERPAGNSYASMQLATILMARGVRAGGPFPDNVWGQLSTLPGIRIDRNSITQDGNDVIFRAWLTQDDGREKEVWARAGTVRHLNAPNANGTQHRGLEAKLIDASQELKAGEGGGGNKDTDKSHKNGGGEDDPPGGKRNHAGDGPGDRERNGVHLSRMGMETMVAFASSREEVLRMPHISD